MEICSSQYLLSGHLLYYVTSDDYKVEEVYKRAV